MLGSQPLRPTQNNQLRALGYPSLSGGEGGLFSAVPGLRSALPTLHYFSWAREGGVRREGRAGVSGDKNLTLLNRGDARSHRHLKTSDFIIKAIMPCLVAQGGMDPCRN